MGVVLSRGARLTGSDGCADGLVVAVGAEAAGLALVVVGATLIPEDVGWDTTGAAACDEDALAAD